VLAPTPAAVELARARCALGSSPDVADEEAIPLLEAASDAAHARGAVGIRDRARAALRRRGRQPDTRSDEVRWLSTTERRILDLTSAGLGVCEVAQRLLLTPGMVRAALEADSSQAVQ
jgi:DNA-binding NarL/FixJ family response regulator